MDKSSESSSDSDSNSSTSWVFVDDTTITPQKAANTFHLDCSREPIQELTEQDLLSVSSDVESDTDGISVISESEMPIDDPTSSLLPSNSKNDDSETSSVRDDDDNGTDKAEITTLEPNENENSFNYLTKMFKPLHMLGIGVVLTAVVLASYSQLMTKLSEQKGDDFTIVDDVALYDEIDLKASSDLNKKLFDEKNDLGDELAQIVDITISCTHDGKPRNNIKENEIKKCVKKHYRKEKGRKVTNEDFAEWIEKSKIIVNDKSSESLQEEFKHIKLKYNKMPKIIGSEELSGNFDENIIRSFDQDYAYVKQKYSKNSNKERLYNENNNDDTVYKPETGDVSYKVEKKEKKVKFERSEHKPKPHNNKKYDSKEILKDFKIHDPRLEKRKHPSKRYVPLKKSHENSQGNNNKRQYDFTVKKFKSSKEYKHKDKSHYKDFNKYNHKTFINFNDKNNIKYKDEVANKSAKINEKDRTFKLGNNFVTQQKRNGSTSGEWYINLHKARTQIRKQEHVSDWVFDRAHIRNKKRNKAQWYFKWMHLREQLRYKQSYRPYSS